MGFPTYDVCHSQEAAATCPLKGTPDQERGNILRCSGDDGTDCEERQCDERQSSTTKSIRESGVDGLNDSRCEHKAATGPVGLDAAGV